MAVLATSVTSKSEPGAIESAFRSVISLLGRIRRSPARAQPRLHHLMTEWATSPRIFSFDAVCTVSRILTGPAGASHLAVVSLGSNWGVQPSPSQHGSASPGAVRASRERIEGGHADATGGARGLIVEFRVKKIHFIVVAAPWIPVVSRST
jgi:hypothetical protein